MPILPAILSFLGSALAKTLTDNVIKWVAMKSLLVFLFVTVVPLVLNNFIYELIEIIMNLANTQASSSTFDGAMSFTGFLAWLIECFRLPEALSVLVSALVLRLALSMIPFVRLVG